MHCTDILVDINNIDSNLTTLQNDADDNDTHQQTTSNNVTTDSDPALEYNARESDKLNSNEEENDDPLNEYGAPVCETCLESIIPNFPVVNARVKRSIRSSKVNAPRASSLTEIRHKYALRAYFFFVLHCGRSLATVEPISKLCNFLLRLPC